MTFKLKDLSVLAYANGFSLWHYRTADPAADVDTADYFAAAADMMRIGDLVIATTDGGAKASLLRIASNAGGSIDCADLLAIGTTDTD